jgi:hypothetical protein
MDSWFSLGIQRMAALATFSGACSSASLARVWRLVSSAGKVLQWMPVWLLPTPTSSDQSLGRIGAKGNSPKVMTVPQAKGEPPARDAISLIIKTPARTTGCTIPSKRGSGRLALPPRDHSRDFSSFRPSSGAQRDATQQRVTGVFIPVRTWSDRTVCSHGRPTGLLADPLGRRLELLDEGSETRRHWLHYSVVLDPEPSSNCQQPRSLI